MEPGRTGLCFGYFRPFQGGWPGPLLSTLFNISSEAVVRVLVIGKAKTGTTALVHLIKHAIEPFGLVMEPKSILEFGCERLENNGNEAIKIIYEHFIDQQRHLNSIVHGEFGFPVKIGRAHV